MPGDIVRLDERRHRIMKDEGASVVARPIAGGHPVRLRVDELQWNPATSEFDARATNQAAKA